MAFKTEDLIKSAIGILEKDKDIIFIDDLCVYLGISRQTYYDHDLDKVDVIKKYMLSNKVAIKVKLRNHWAKCENPTTEMFLYKLAANEEELSKVNNTSTVNISNSKKVESLDTSNLTEEELIAYQKLQEKMIVDDKE